jgi:hypothetical protein
VRCVTELLEVVDTQVLFGISHLRHAFLQILIYARTRMRVKASSSSLLKGRSTRSFHAQDESMALPLCDTRSPLLVAAAKLHTDDVRSSGQYVDSWPAESAM